MDAMFTRTKLLILISLFTIIGLMCFGVARQSSRFSPEAGPLGSTAYPATITGLTNQCGPYYDFTTSAKNYGTIPKNYIGPVPISGSSVPMIGYMSDSPFKQEGNGIYEKTFNGYSLDQILRAEWQGYTIVWYEKNLDKATFNYMKKEVLKQNSKGSKLLLMPWFFDNGRTIPNGRDFAYSTWGFSQSCTLYSNEALQEFQDASKDHHVKRDADNPPTGKLEYGILIPIYGQNK